MSHYNDAPVRELIYTHYLHQIQNQLRTHRQSVNPGRRNDNPPF